MLASGGIAQLGHVVEDVLPSVLWRLINGCAMFERKFFDVGSLEVCRIFWDINTLTMADDLYL